MTSGIRHILIADDDVLLRRSVELSLCDSGFRVGTAWNGQEAMNYIRQHRPEVAVIDVFMPEMDGFETLRAIKREFPQIRILIVSGGGSREGFDVLQMTAKLGADGVLQKPFTGQQLVAFITGEGWPDSFH